MIRLSNGHEFEYMTASGALGFDGRGWWWEKPLVWSKLMRLELFTIVLRTITLKPRPYPISNLSWVRPWTWLPWSPLSCTQFLPNESAVNKVDLWNPGIHYFTSDIAPRLDFDRNALVASIYGTEQELVSMMTLLNTRAFKAVELNVSCPNTGHKDSITQIIEAVEGVAKISIHPLILKLSADQDFPRIAEGVCGLVEAFSLNSVPWDHIFSDYRYRSPVAKIGAPGNGGVSGKAAQPANWKAVEVMVKFGHGIPVIAPSVMDYEDLNKVRELGVKAVSFGAIHLRTPWKPTQIVEIDQKKRYVIRGFYD